MPQFIFHLDGVLRHRANIERERQRALAMVEAQLVPLKAQLRALAAEVQASNADVCQNHLIGPIDLNFLAAHRRYLAATQRRALEVAEKMAAVQRKVDDARRVLIAASKDRKVLEKLREKQQAAWQAESDRKEKAADDEVATQMSYRMSH